MSMPIPAPLWEKIRDFLATRPTGQIVLDVRDGQVLAYKLTECGRVEPGAIDYPLVELREHLVH